MAVRINSLDKIKKRLGINKDGKAVAFMTETCYKHMNKYVPMDNNNLRQNVGLTTNTITYESPYAAYQYYGQREDGSYKVQNYTTPGTGPYWDKRMLSAEKAEVIKEIQNFIRGK